MKKMVSLLLCVAVLASMMTIPVMASADISPTHTNAVGAAAPASFHDTENHWAAKSIERWTQYNIIQGEQDGKFNPDDDLTRAAMATVLSKLLGLSATAENSYTDVKPGAWYADAVLKCTAAGIMKGDGGNANPDASISRQEAMVMLARALGIAPAAKADLSAFKDAAQVESWAAPYVAAMTQRGIVSGVGDNLVAPNADMSRASVMTVLDKAVSDYINTAGTYDKVGGTGIVLVTAPDVILKGNKIAGSLLVSEGVGEGNFTLDGTTVAGKTTVRGGGVNSFVVTGGSKLGDVTIARVDGAVRVVTSDGSAIETTYIDDGKDDVIMEGSFGNVSVAGEVPVTLKGADVKTVTATGKNADITVDKDSKVVTVATTQENTKITVAGSVTTVAATEKAVGVNVTVSKGGTTANVTTAAPNSNITVAGTVTNLSATKEAVGVNMNVSEGGNAKNVITGAPNSTISNDGKMGTVSISKDATTAKIVVGEKSTMDKIVSENKANLTVTTAAAEKAAKEAAAAKAAAEKAAADKLAAEKAMAEAKTAEQKLAAEKAAADAKAAADKAAAEKSAAEKAATDAKSAADKAAADADKKTENKPVDVPEAPKADENKPGEIVVPNPVEPEKPTPPPSGGGGSDPGPTYYTVTFDSAGGSAVAAVSVADGATLTKPAEPTKDTAAFMGWFHGEIPYNFASPVTGAITLTAKWGNLANLSGAQWEQDRAAPKSWNIADGWITHETTEQQAQNSWYDWQGRGQHTKVDYTADWAMETEIEITEAMLNGKAIRASLWIQVDGVGGTSAQNKVIDWPILQYIRDPATQKSAWQWFDSTDPSGNGWHNLALVPTAGKHTMKTQYHAGTIYQYIDGALVNSYALKNNEDGLSSPSCMIVQSKTFGESYTVKWKVPTIKYAAGAPYASISESRIDEIITGGIEDVNLIPAFTYAKLDKPDADNVVQVRIGDGTVTVAQVYMDIVNTLLKALQANATEVSSVSTANGASLPITADGSFTIEQIADFVKGSGLTGAGGQPIAGNDVLSALYNKTLDVTVDTVYNDHYTYHISFKQLTVGETAIDEVIRGGIEDINLVLRGTGKHYARLSALGTGDDNNNVIVDILNGDTKVTSVYDDIIATLLRALKDNAYQVKSISTGEGASKNTLDVSKTPDANEIIAFVRASGLKGAGGVNAVAGNDSIKCLHGQTLTATVNDIYDVGYTYRVAFKVFVDKTVVDEIINGGIEDVNLIMKKPENGNYARISALDESSTAVVNITDASKTVTTVYSHIIDTLVAALNAQDDKMAQIAIGSATLHMNEAITPEIIEAFVKASGLHGTGAETITGADTIGELDTQGFTATVTDVNGATYDYTVNFAVAAA